ncbi:MAG: PIN domain-containing protein [Candidatus Diapherotrites archaeon]
MPRTLIDTNILVYFADKNDIVRHEKARVIIKNVEKNPSAYVIAQQCLREFGNVMVNKNMPAVEINAYIQEFTFAFPDILSESIGGLQRAVVSSRDDGVDFFDALLAYTALDRDISIIYTENTKDFEKIPGIKAVNPLK